MRQPHHAAAEPRILPLPTAGIAVRDLLDEAVAAAVARAPAGVAVTVDTPSGARIAADPGGLRGLLDRLVTAAVAAADAAALAAAATSKSRHSTTAEHFL